MKIITNALLTAAIFAASAAAQSQTANVPVRINVSQNTALTVTMTPPASGGTAINNVSISRNKDTTFTLNLKGTTSVSHQMLGQNTAAMFRHKRGSVSLNLPSQNYENATVSLYSANGKLILNSNFTTAANGTLSISRPSVPAGVYILSVKSTDGSTFASRLPHCGGKLSINTTFNSANITAPQKAASSGNAGSAWTISVTAGTPYSQTLTGKFVPKPGDNSLITVTFSSSSGSSINIPSDMEVIQPGVIIPGGEGSGFEPEAMGMTPDSTCEGMRFAWLSTGSSSTPRIRIYSENDEIVEEKAGVSGSASSGKRSNKVHVRGLEPATIYKYSVSNNGSEWSKKYRFRTPPPVGTPFRFVALGDPQIDHDTVPKDITTNFWKATMVQINKQAPSFIMSAGDQVDNQKDDEFLDVFSPPELRHIPFAPTMGNHDGQRMNYYYNLPNSRASSSSYYIQANYWFLYNNILFVMPNTGWMYNGLGINRILTEVTRYDSLFTAAKAATAGKYDWIVCVHHRSTRSIASHSMSEEDHENSYFKIPMEYRDENMRLLRDAGFEDVIDKHGVDLVIAGHDHIYVRSKPLKGNKIVSDGQGTVYLTMLPAASHKFYPIMAPNGLWDDNKWIEKSYPASREQFGWERKHAYVVFDVDGKKISAIVLNVDGRELDKFELSK